MPPAAKPRGGLKQLLGCGAKAGLRALCRCHAFPHLIDKGGRLHQAVTGQTKGGAAESQVAVFDPLGREAGKSVSASSDSGSGRTTASIAYSSTSAADSPVSMPSPMARSHMFRKRSTISVARSPFNEYVMSKVRRTLTVSAGGPP